MSVEIKKGTADEKPAGVAGESGKLNALRSARDITRILKPYVEEAADPEALRHMQALYTRLWELLNESRTSPIFAGSGDPASEADSLSGGNEGEILATCIAMTHTIAAEFFNRPGHQLGTRELHFAASSLFLMHVQKERRIDDPDFQEFAQKTIERCLEVMISTDWGTAGEFAGEGVRFAAIAHHTVKEDFVTGKRAFEAAEREGRFLSWAGEKTGIKAETYGECVLAVSIFFTAWSRTVIDSCTNDEKSRIRILGVAAKLNHLLWQFDPARHGPDFIAFAKPHLHSYCKLGPAKQRIANLLQRSPVLENAQPPVSPVIPEPDPAHVANEEEAPSQSGTIPAIETTVPAADQQLESPRVSGHVPSRQSLRKQAAAERRNTAPKATTPEPEPEVPTVTTQVPVTADLQEVDRQSRVMEYVRGQVPGKEACWDYNEAVAALEAHYQTEATARALGLLVDELRGKKPNQKALAGAVSAILQEVMGNFSPKDGKSSYFRGQMHTAVNTNIVEYYSARAH